MKPRRISPKAVQVLGYVAAGYGPWNACRGRSQHGGRDKIIQALLARGFLMMLPGYRYSLTLAGAEELAVRTRGPGL